MISYQIISVDALEESMMNNTEIIKQMIPMYLGQGVQDFSDLEAAVYTKNYAEIKAKAHHIKPTIQYLGATELRLKFQKLEDSALNQEPIHEIAALFEDIKKDFELAMNELKSYQLTLK